jgi:hypothetical protein
MVRRFGVDGLFGQQCAELAAGDPTGDESSVLEEDGSVPVFVNDEPDGGAVAYEYGVIGRFCELACAGGGVVSQFGGRLWGVGEAVGIGGGQGSVSVVMGLEYVDVGLDPIERFLDMGVVPIPDDEAYQKGCCEHKRRQVPAEPALGSFCVAGWARRVG